MNKRVYLLLLLFLAMPLASAQLDIYKPWCADTGKMGFNLGADEEFGIIELKDVRVLIYENNGVQGREIQGEWDRADVKWEEGKSSRDAKFVTEEAIVRTNGVHRIVVEYPLNERTNTVSDIIGCTGTVFSCQLFDFEIDKCESNNGTFTAEFSTIGLDAHIMYPESQQYSFDEDVEILFVTDKQYCDQKGNCARTAGLPVGAFIENIAPNNYRVTWENYQSTVKSFSVKLVPAEICLRQEEEYGVHDFKNCDPDPFVKEFKCSGCEIGEVCIAEGTTVVQEGEQKYCKNGFLVQQKPIGTSCTFDNECATGYCFQNSCEEELLRTCPEGNLLYACKCGDTDTRDWENKFCCDGSISDTECPNTEIEEIIEVSCGENEYLEDGVCIKEQKRGFFEIFWNFLRNMFSRK